MLSKKISLKMLLIVFGGVGVVAAVIGGVVIALGLPTISARVPHLQLTGEVLHTVFKNNVARRADMEPPVDIEDPGRVKLGAQHYANVCSKCHGGPDLGQNPMALSMRPRPQHLPSVVDQFTDPELFVILRDGVRLSAMPAWPSDGNFDEIWSVVAFLRQLPGMDSATYVDLIEPVDSAEAPVMAYEGAQDLRDSTTGIKAPPLDEYLYASPATEWTEIAVTGMPVARCATCHGADGSGVATDGRAPNLTLQSAAYITESLRAYSTGARESGVMKVVAAGLTDTQMSELGTYYDSLPDVTLTPSGASAEMLSLGEKIAQEGKHIEAVAPCFTCHQRGATVPGADIPVPQIAGQNVAYLSQQLHAYAEGERGSIGHYNPMPHEASNLTSDEITAVSNYLANLPAGHVGEAYTATPDLENAKGIVTRVCSECHTETGVGSPSGEYPNLTLQYPSYLAQQLNAFQANIRTDHRMTQTAAQLEESDITDLAAYFGSLPPAPSRGATDADLAARGATIAQNGLPEDGVPACLTCHNGPQTSEIRVIARLNGQNATYLQQRLDYFARESSVPLSGLNPMHEFAKAMTEDQRREVAAWFATQTPLPK